MDANINLTVKIELKDFLMQHQVKISVNIMAHKLHNIES
jgi:hypothetical protein